MATYLRQARRLDFFEKPDYAYLRGLFTDLFDRSGFGFDYEYDWAGKTLPAPLGTGGTEPPARGEGLRHSPIRALSSIIGELNADAADAPIPAPVEVEDDIRCCCFFRGGRGHPCGGASDPAGGGSPHPPRQLLEEPVWVARSQHTDCGPELLT